MPLRPERRWTDRVTWRARRCAAALKLSGVHDAARRDWVRAVRPCSLLYARESTASPRETTGLRRAAYGIQPVIRRGLLAEAALGHRHWMRSRRRLLVLPRAAGNTVGAGSGTDGDEKDLAVFLIVVVAALDPEEVDRSDRVALAETF